MSADRRSSVGPLVIVGALAAMLTVGVLAVLAGLLGSTGGAGGCGVAQTGSSAAITLGPPGSGQTVGATEYGGPGDRSSGQIGSSGANLLAQPDSYAELGGTTFATATAMGGLPYGTPLRITWGARSAIAYKRDIGLGGGPIDGHPRVIDLWWELAGGLGIPYEDGLWSGAVRIARTPATGSAAVLGQAVQASGAGPSAQPAVAADVAGDLLATPVSGSSSGAASASSSGAVSGSACRVSGGVELTSGPRAVLLPDGQAEVPVGAPAAVKGIIAAGNQIVGKPYVYGGGHGLPLSEIAGGYDCSSSVAHLLWGGGLLAVDTDMVAREFEAWGDPGPGKWVTLYASDDHVFMYVAGLRWDTHNAAGPQDGTTGIGWHPLVREADGFVARHPPGL